MRRLIEILITLLFALLLNSCAFLFREAVEAHIRIESALPASEVRVTLQDSFIQKYKDRVTIDVMLTVEKADKVPHHLLWDGDFHLVGQSSKVGLPVVAEIKNARFEPKALDLVRRAEGTGRPIPVAGAWRLWAEHIGQKDEVQGEPLSESKATNPNHVFEIHPVTRVNGLTLLNSFRPILGYIPGKAPLSFRVVENIPCRIIPGASAISIMMRKALVNDVEFLMELTEDRQEVVADGRFLNAAVSDLEGNLLVQKVRLVFVKDTPPEKVVRKLKPGDRLHVFGLPRVNLSAVAWRVKNSTKNPQLLDLNLPYEILVAGVYPIQAVP